MAVLRFVRLLAMVVWVGGLVFFAFILAPTAFHSLPSVHLAGLVVGNSLRTFHTVGLVCGAAFGMATGLLAAKPGAGGRRRFLSELVLAGVMLVETGFLQVHVLPAMEADRVLAGGDIDAVAKANPARVDFDRLHVWSEREEGLVLFCGLGVLALMSAEPTDKRAIAG